MKGLLARAVIVAALSGWALAAVSTTANAQTTGPCVAAINGQDVRAHTESSNPMEVEAATGVQIVVATSPSDEIRLARVDLEFAPFRWTVLDQAVVTTTWVGSFDLGEGARYGVGLYRAVADVQLASGASCTAAAWFYVTGRPPFTTLAGVGAVFMVVLGLLLQVAGVVRGVRGGGGLGFALAGGIPTGAGAILLAQQFGAQSLAADSIALWVAAPAAAGGIVQRLSRQPTSTVKLEIPEDAARVEMPPPVRPPHVPPDRPEPEARPDRTERVPSEVPPPVAPSPRPPPWTAPAPTPVPLPPETRPEPAPSPAMPPAGGRRGPDTDGDVAAPAPPERSRGVGISLGVLLRRRRKRVPDEAPLGPEPERAVPGERDPPRSAYARLDCPDVVVVGDEFELVVGLAQAPSPDVVGEPLRVPPTSRGAYTLSIQVVADGFSLREGESWRVQLPVTYEDPYPSTALHLIAESGPESIKARAIRALFSVEGQTMGMAFRSVVVARTARQVEEAEREPQEAGVDISIPTGWAAPDLTVRILEGESEGRLLWTFESAHEGVDLPDEPPGSELGDADDPKSFARQLVDRVNAREGKPGLYQYLVGVGRTIAEQMPEEFWGALAAVAEIVRGRAPTLLILSEEPYIPWELAVVEPPIDTGAPPFLSAQTEVGRWVLGHKRPKLPPPITAQVSEMAVISGVYERPGWARLVQAEEEAAQLSDQYGAVKVNASAQEVLNCLAGSPPADLMHFAVHGVYDPAGLEDGVVLVDGHALDPMEIKGSTFTTTPFVFLNACQVGSGNRILGDHAGLAAAFLWSGACGVVAPLWSIKDSVAKEVAVRFYEQAFEGTSIGTVLRNERAAFKPTHESLSATYLAYQYFGHPGMKISRSNGNGRG